MNIVLKKISEIAELSNYFKKVAQSHNWIYMFDIIPDLDNLDRYRGVGEKSISNLKIFLQKYPFAPETTKKELNDIVSRVSKTEIKFFNEIIHSKEFKKLDAFFLDLHQKGFSNQKVLLSLANEEIGVLYKPGAFGMNNQLFLETIKIADRRDKQKLLNYLGQTKKLFMRAYQEKILEYFH